jgi:hypothetical protein
LKIKEALITAPTLVTIRMPRAFGRNDERYVHRKMMFVVIFRRGCSTESAASEGATTNVLKMDVFSFCLSARIPRPMITLMSKLQRIYFEHSHGRAAA